MVPIEAAPYYVVIRNELAHTTAQIVWHKRNANYAVVASILPGYGPWYHFLTELDGEWIVSKSSYHHWLPYNTPEQKGVLVDIQPIDAQVKRGRVLFRDQEMEVPVNANYLSTVIWDVYTSTAEEKLTYLELLVEERWHECVVSWYPATAQQFAEAYLAYYRSGDKGNQDSNWWAVDLLFSSDRQDRLKLALVIIDYADLSQDEDALGCLGAGPLEDLMSDWLLDRLEKVVSNNMKLRYALSMVRMEFEEERLQRRLAKLLSGSTS